MKIIGITGQARAGKDSVAKILVEEFDFERVALADPLKQMALAIDPFVESEVFHDSHLFERLSDVIRERGWEKAKAYPDVRRLLQRIGTEGVRNVLGENVWVDTLLKKLHPAGRYVVPDVRFLNEAEAIRNVGGQVWRVTRPGFDGDGHASETEMKDIVATVHVHNGGSMDSLVARVRELARG